MSQWNSDVLMLSKEPEVEKYILLKHMISGTARPINIEGLLVHYTTTYSLWEIVISTADIPCEN